MGGGGGWGREKKLFWYWLRSDRKITEKTFQNDLHDLSL